MAKEPYSKTEARKRALTALNKGDNLIIFTGYCQKRIRQRNLIDADILNVLKSSHARVQKEAEWEGNEWRYQIETNKIRVIFKFSGDYLVIINAVRKGAKK